MARSSAERRGTDMHLLQSAAPASPTNPVNGYRFRGGRDCTRTYNNPAHQPELDCRPRSLGRSSISDSLQSQLSGARRQYEVQWTWITLNICQVQIGRCKC